MIKLYGAVTPCRTTGPGTGLSSVPCETPGGVIVSITSGTVLGSSEQIASAPSTGQTPSVNAPGVGVNEMAWSALKPFWPVIATVNVQPLVGVPNSAAGRAIVIVLATVEATTAVGVPTWPPEALTHTGEANPWTSRRSLQASAGAIV